MGSYHCQSVWHQPAQGKGRPWQPTNTRNHGVPTVHCVCMCKRLSKRHIQPHGITLPATYIHSHIQQFPMRKCCHIAVMKYIIHKAHWQGESYYTWVIGASLSPNGITGAWWTDLPLSKRICLSSRRQGALAASRPLPLYVDSDMCVLAQCLCWFSCASPSGPYYLSFVVNGKRGCVHSKCSK